MHAVAKDKEGHNKQETTRGASLRELQRFFKEHDKNEGYAGLRRIPDEDGTALWTILEDTEVGKQLENRTGERLDQEKGGGMTTPKLGPEATPVKVEDVNPRFEGGDSDLYKSCGCIPKKWRSKQWSSKEMVVAQPSASRVVASSAEQ